MLSDSKIFSTVRGSYVIGVLVVVVLNILVAQQICPLFRRRKGGL